MIARAKKHVGIYGGSFDPIHLGHLIVAQDCLAQAGLESVIFVPTAQSPLKSHAPRTEDKHRLEMVKRSIAHQSAFNCSDHEIERGGVSYTIETIQHFKNKQPETEFHLIIGQDQIEQLLAWHAIETLVKTVNFIAVCRPGYTAEPPKIPGIRFQTIETHAMDISSSEIRERFQNGLSNELFLHPEVSRYITKQGIYGHSA